MENSLLDNYKKEFRSEIANASISVDNLKSVGISNFTLQSEIYLRKFYGEDILMDDDLEVEIDLSKKKIEKVDLKKINSVSELTKYIDDISKSEFDSAVEVLLTKINRDEE